MAERTNISWADATLSFWIGCTKVSPACDHCYAEVYGNRFGVKWGPKEARRVTKNWVAKANKIMREAANDNIARPFVFSNSLSDIFDNEVPIETLAAAFDVMRRFPKAVFLLLTKRPQNILKRFTEIAKAALGPYADDEGIRAWWPKNAAIGCTVVSQAEADRDIPWLLRARAALRPAFAFLSMEPLLGRVDLTNIWGSGWARTQRWDCLRGMGNPSLEVMHGMTAEHRIDWVITGGESGAHARPSLISWFMHLRDQCTEAGVAFHHKQNGEWDCTGVAVVEAADKNRWRDQGRPAVTMVNRTMALALNGETLAGDYAPIYRRVGKDKAGREIGGETWDARPAVAA